jgi:hypothetical protein
MSAIIAEMDFLGAAWAGGATRMAGAVDETAAIEQSGDWNFDSPKTGILTVLGLGF